MPKSDIITMAITFSLGTICLVISIFQFMEKGFLFNNAYILASKSQRERMDKKPHYRQSAIAFLGLSLIFITIGLSFIIKEAFALTYAFTTFTVIYAVVSSSVINKK